MKNRPYIILSIIAAIMLLLALVDWPYGYYQILRLVVCGAGGYIAYTAYEMKKMWAVWLFGFIAVLFNPLFPIHLDRELWAVIDVICGILFLMVAFLIKNTDQKP